MTSPPFTKSTTGARVSASAATTSVASRSPRLPAPGHMRWTKRSYASLRSVSYRRTVAVSRVTVGNNGSAYARTPYSRRISLIFFTFAISITSAAARLTLKFCSKARTRFRCPIESHPSTVSGDDPSSMSRRSSPNTPAMRSSTVLIRSLARHRDPGGALQPVDPRVQFPQLDRLGAIDGPEAVPPVQVFRGAILRARYKLADEFPHITAPRGLADTREKHGLHRQSHDATTQQDAVDPPGITLRPHDGRPDEPVVPES